MKNPDFCWFASIHCPSYSSNSAAISYCHASYLQSLFSGRLEGALKSTCCAKNGKTGSGTSGVIVCSAAISCCSLKSADFSECHQFSFSDGSFGSSPKACKEGLDFTVGEVERVMFCLGYSKSRAVRPCVSVPFGSAPCLSSSLITSALHFSLTAAQSTGSKSWSRKKSSMASGLVANVLRTSSAELLRNALIKGSPFLRPATFRIGGGVKLRATPHCLGLL
mmetsp:Transcript_113885/g.179256  ORF Transcript_113885/g.179256 Transcript_113885/m.179256 type:complete len:222 (-) Transcript_113885:257-922(-)